MSRPGAASRATDVDGRQITPPLWLRQSNPNPFVRSYGCTASGVEFSVVGACCTTLPAAVGSPPPIAW